MLAGKATGRARLRWAGFRTVWRVLVSGWLVITVPGPATAQRDPPGTRSGERESVLEGWLEERDLDPLLIAHWQGKLDGAASNADRRRAASRLIELYSRQLTGDPDSFANASRHWARLSGDFPDLMEPSLAIKVAFGEFRQALQLYHRWMQQGETAVSGAELHRRFANLAQRAESLIQATGPPFEGPAETTGEPGLILGGEPADPRPVVRLPEPVRPDGVPGETRPVAAVSLQARHLLAWSLYYQAITGVPGDSRDAGLQRAARLFADLLQIPPGRQLTELGPNRFSPDSIWWCRNLTGLATVLQAVGDDETAACGFRLLADPRVPAALRRRAAVHRFQSMYLPGQLSAAVNTVESWVVSPPDQAGTELWSTIAAAGLGGRIHPGPDKLYDRLSIAGLGKLVELNDWTSIDSLLGQTPRAVPVSGLTGHWLEGYRRLRFPRRASDGAESAVPLLQEAVRLASGNNPGLTAERPFELRARCRYHLGMALFRLSRYEDAARHLDQASAVLNHADRQSAEEAAWLHCRSLQRLCRADPAWQESLAVALRDFQLQYPRSTHRGDARFMELVWQPGLVASDARESRLRSIEPGDPRYPQALLERGRLAHQRWSAARDRGEDTGVWAAKLVESAERLLNSSDWPSTVSADSVRLRSCLLVADVLLHEHPADPQRAATWLSRIEPFADPEALAPELMSDYHALNLKIAGRLGRTGSRLESARWLSRHAPTLQRRRTGWLAESELREQQWRAAADSAEAADLARQAIALCRQLTDDLPADQAIVEDPLVIQAMGRLASLQLETGDPAAALPQYRRLNRVQPADTAWVIGIARCCMALGRWPEAATAWQRIAAVTDHAEAGWLEARFELARCLQASGSPQAGVVVRQVWLLAPDMPEPWRQRFRQLESGLPGGQD